MMAIVKCPECGKRVNYRYDQVRLRCPDCGRKFRAPDEEDFEEERSRTRYKRKSPNKLLIPAILGGVGFLVLTIVVIVLVLGKGDSGRRGIELREVELVAD